MTRSACAVAGFVSLSFLFMCISGYRGDTRRQEEIRNARVWTASELQSTSAARLDGQIVKIEGAIRCDKPAISLVTKTPSVWYSMDIADECRSKRGSRWRTVESTVDSAWFAVRDRTGYTWVNPENAWVLGLETVCSTIGQSPTLPLLSDCTGRRRTREWVLRASGKVVVVGRAGLVNGAPVISLDDRMTAYPGIGMGSPLDAHMETAGTSASYRTAEPRELFAVCRTEKDFIDSQERSKGNEVVLVVISLTASIVFSLAFFGVRPFAGLVKQASPAA